MGFPRFVSSHENFFKPLSAATLNGGKFSRALLVSAAALRERLQHSTINSNYENNQTVYLALNTKRYNITALIQQSYLK